MPFPEEAPNPRPHGRRLSLLLTGALLAILVTGLAWNGSENFHAVIPGAVYRSGQPSPGSLANHIAELGIRSIINVRASNPDALWYQEERAVAARHGVRHYSLGTNSGCPLPDEVRALVPLLEICPKPVLVHCQSGIDRTGPVAAICILLLDENPDSLPRAQAQLGLWYGHMFWRENTVRHRAFLSLYQDWLTQNGYAHSRDRFREWALRVYDHPPE
jgi:protein tyrosine phosphatase (PTP) superfamily phosphohydrolase (DUF442 family)